jgi:hypothetical protein
MFSPFNGSSRKILLTTLNWSGNDLSLPLKRLPAFPQSGRVVPEVNNPAIREVI